MNKLTVRRLFERAAKQREQELGQDRWKANREVSKRTDVMEINKQIRRLTTTRDRLVDQYVKPRKAKAEKELKAFREEVERLKNALGFAVTPEEKARAVQDIKLFLKKLPNCPEAKML